MIGGPLLENETWKGQNADSTCPMDGPFFGPSGCLAGISWHGLSMRCIIAPALADRPVDPFLFGELNPAKSSVRKALSLACVATGPFRPPVRHHCPIVPNWPPGRFGPKRRPVQPSF
jgi:hypothetical protein